MRRFSLLFLFLLPACTHQKLPPLSRDPYHRGQLLYADDFSNGLRDWFPELEAGGSVTARDGVLDIDVPRGCTLWFRHKLTGPVLIEYEVQAIQHGGKNDRASDINCFWMATDPRSPGDILAHPRSGKFADYDQLLTYYVGLGGNSNTTTRFRRYIGSASSRPLLPQNDLRDPADLITPNLPTKIQLVACGPIIRYIRDGRILFDYHDPAPYTAGSFAFRTTQSHLQIRQFRVYRLYPNF